MPRVAEKVVLSKAERIALEGIVARKTHQARLVQRAKMILLCAEGKPVQMIAEKLDVRPHTVTAWRRRYQAEGINGLTDRARPGKPVTYDTAFREQVLRLLEETPPDGLASWDGPAIADRLGVSKDAVWRLLRNEGICLSRQRSWCVSTDPEFIPKAADVIGLYLNPPLNAIVLSVDEKPSMQALERATGYVKTSSGKIARGLKSTYKRHGTLNLFAALNVASGHIEGKITTHKKRPDFLEFMDEVVAEHPADKDIHVILDNYCIHKKNEEWLERHANVTFHFTPTSASWLNQVEIWFGILSRKVLRGASFAGTHELKDAVERYIAAYNKTPQPFVWKKREVVGSQLRNTVANLCN